MPDLSRFSLFPTVEEQIENIAQAQAEEQRQSEMELPVFRVPDDVVDRALTSGGNDAHCIERIVAFFQKGPSNEDAAAFLAKEYGVGGKGVTIAGEKYAMWFDESGIRICPGNSTYGTVAVDIPWAAAAVHIFRLLRDGMFASQEKINAAPDNEFRELAAKLWYLRQDFSDSAKEQNLLPTISQHFLGKGFPEDTKEIAELLKTPVHRQQILQELDAFMVEYKYHPDLLRFRKIHDPVELLKSIDRLSAVKEQYKAAEGFIPVKASFITEDEITQLLLRGGNISESKLRIYAYFKQGHDAKECAVFLRNEYGEGGSTHGGYDESHGSKGIQFTRSDEESGYKGYDTVKLNWNQVQKRIRALIDNGQYLNGQEKEHLPAYEKVTLARRIYQFYSTDPNQTNPPGDDMAAAVKKIRSALESDNPEKKSALFDNMFSVMAAVSPDSPEYQRMMPVLRDVEAFKQNEYSLYAPLPEDVLQAERQAKEAKRKAPAPQYTTSEVPSAPEGGLAAAAHALAQKMQKNVPGDEDGQFNLFNAAPPVVQEPPAQQSSPAVQALERTPTVRELYVKYVDIVKNLVLADTAYQNACVNSDKENACLEGNEAVKRAALTLTDDTAFFRLYSDNAAFHNRLHQEIVSETYPILSQSQQEKAAGNGAEQPHIPETSAQQSSPAVQTVAVQNGEDVALTFDQDGKAVEPAPDAGTSAARDPLAPAYRLGDTVYLEDKPYIIRRNHEIRIELWDQAQTPPEVRTIDRSDFVRLLLLDRRNKAITDYLSAYLPETNDDLREALVGDGGLLELRDKAVIAGYIQAGEDNLKIAQRLADTYAGTAETMTMLTGDQADYFAGQSGFEVHIHDKFDTKVSMTWNLVAPILRALYQQELDGFLHEAPTVDNSGPELAEGGTEIPPEPAETSVPEQAETADTAPAEPDLTPNVDEYLNLKVQHPDKLIGVQVGEYMLFYGKDADEAAHALGKNRVMREIPGLGNTAVTGISTSWQYVLKKLLEHGNSVVLARPDPEQGPDAPYEIIKERDAADYIPLGMELTMDGRRMKIDRVDYNAGTVSLLDMDLKGWLPVFRSEPVPFVRQYVEEQQVRDLEAAAQRDMEPLTAGVQEEQNHAEADDLETAKQLIQDFCADLYHVEEMDFSNPEHIGIAYTTTEDEKHEIQVAVNLLDFSISKLVDDECVERRGYNSLRELIDNELTKLDFAELVRLEHDLPPEPERAELDGGKITPPPAAPATTKVVGRVDTGLFEVVVQKMHVGPERRNFQITDDSLGMGGEKTKYQHNVAAIRTLKQIEAEGRLATPEEQEILSRYVGWGGIAKAFDPDDPRWAKEYAELKELLTPEEYNSARSTVLNAHYARFVP